jgi:hypothetical protein
MLIFSNIFETISYNILQIYRKFLNEFLFLSKIKLIILH